MAFCAFSTFPPLSLSFLLHFLKILFGATVISLREAATMMAERLLTVKFKSKSVWEEEKEEETEEEKEVILITQHSFLS